MEATNELGFATLEVTDAVAVNLPTPVYGGAAHADLTGTECNPMHALISVEGGTVRYRVDGTTVIDPFGTPAYSGTFIDWTDALHSYQSFISRASFIAAAGSGPVTLNISWRS